jgi:hypothetical protein
MLGVFKSVGEVDSPEAPTRLDEFNARKFPRKSFWIRKKTSKEFLQALSAGGIRLFR